MADGLPPAKEGRVSDIERRLAEAAPVTIGQSEIHALLKGAVLLGHDPAAIMKKAGMRQSDYSDPELQVDGRQFHRLLHVLQGELNDLYMGFTATPAKLAMERVLMTLRCQCTSFGESLRTATQFREAARNDIRYDYIDDVPSRSFTLVVDYQTLPELDREFYHWHRLMSVLRYSSWLIGRRIVLSNVDFEGPEPTDLAVMRRYGIFDCELRFNQPHYAITFDRKYLLAPVVRKNEAENLDYTANHSDWFVVPGQGVSWSRQTEQALISLQRDGVWTPTISLVASMLSIGPQTLRRRLADEGTNFSGIKGQLRCEMAVAYLMTTDMPITVIAEEVGFNEAGDFTRAFIGWTGMTPSAYRSDHARDKDLITACAARLLTRHRTN